MGATSEHWDFWHVSNISRDFERDWARAFFLPDGALITYLSFQKSLSFTSQPQKTPELGRNGSATHLWISQVNRPCPCKKRIHCLRSQMTVALKVCMRQRQISIRSRLKSRQNILRLPQKHSFHFQHPIFVKQDFLQWQQPKWDYGVNWT